MYIHRAPPLSGAYALTKTPSIDLAGASEAVAGLVRFAAGTRSPETGLRTSGSHEMGYVISGRLRIETAGEEFEVQSGDVLVASPAEPHSTTALEASEIFFVLVNPHLAAQP